MTEPQIVTERFFRHGVYVLDDVSRAPGKIPG